MNINKIESFLFFTLGITSTFTAIQFGFNGFQLSLFNYVILLLNFFHFIKSGFKIYIQKSDAAIGMFFVTLVISTLLNITVLPNAWANESIKAMMKFLLIYSPFLFLYGKNQLNAHLSMFFKGLIISFIVQFIWSLLQLYFWNSQNIVINQIVFGDILKIKTNHSWLTWHNGFRTTGISWESANLGICMVVGIFLAKKNLLKICFFIGLLFTGSRSALVAFLLGCLLYIINKLYNKLKTKKSSMKSNILFKYFICLLVIIIGLKLTGFDKILLDSLNNFMERLTEFDGDLSANRHMDYYFKLYDILKESPVKFVFGFGTSAAGLPYTELFNWGSIIGAWNPESDVITILIGNGIIGFVFYYIWQAQLLYKYKNNKIIFFMLVTIMIAGIFYLYLRTWVTLVLIILWKLDLEDFDNPRDIDKRCNIEK